MKYFKQSFKYFLDKGPYLVLIGAVPALLTPFLVSPSTTLYYLLQFNTLERGNFGEMFLQMHFLPYDFFYLGIIGLILGLLSVSLSMGAIDRHMRVGEFTIGFSRAKNRLNYNIVTAFKIVFIAVLMFLVYTVVTTLLYYLWAVALGRGTTWLVFSVITYIIMSTIFLFAMSAIILWPPFMLHTGENSCEAFKTAWRQITGRVTSVAASLALIVVPFQVIMIITGALNCGTVVKTVLDGVYLAIIAPFYLVLMYTIFYDVTGTERVDLTKVDLWSKKSKRKNNMKNGKPGDEE